jgi:alcohol dehydrogenase
MTNLDFLFQHRTRILFGCGRAASIGPEAARCGRRAVLVCDEGLARIGLTDPVRESLKAAGVDCALYSAIHANPRDTECEKLAAFAKEFQTDLIIGLGGGSAMDAAKAAAVLIANGGSCEHWALEEQFPNAPMPLICVPTTAGTGSEVTFEAVITVEASKKKVSISKGAALAPELAILDPELTRGLPPLLTASTGMDALTHAIEAFTCKYSNPLSDTLALGAIQKISGAIFAAARDGGDLRARSDMLLGSLMAGVAFTNSDLGAVHALSEPIGGFYDAPHGVVNAIFLPFVTEYNLPSDLKKHARVAECLGAGAEGASEEEQARRGVEKLFAMNEALKIPKLKDLKGVRPEDFERLAESCENHGCTEANPRPIDAKGFLEILRAAYGGRIHPLRDAEGGAPCGL